MIATYVPDPDKADGAPVVSNGTGGGATNAEIIAATLTGFSTAGYESAPVTAAMSILEAFEQLEYCTQINNAKVTGADRALVAGDTFTGAVNVNHTFSAYRVELGDETLNYAASVDVDMNSRAWKLLTLAGNVAFTTSNRANKRETSIKIVCDGTNRTFSFPSWVFVGGAAPGSIAAGKTAVLSLRAFGANDSDIIASYVVQA